MIDKCWLAEGQGGITLTPTGYGKTYLNGRTESVHRVVYEIYYGHRPDEVLHRCDVPACYNPRHLVGGTHAQNMADMKRKGRARGPVGEEQHDAVLTETQVLEIRRWLSKPNRVGTQRALAKQYGVTPSTITKIKQRETWKHLPE